MICEPGDLPVAATRWMMVKSTAMQVSCGLLFLTKNSRGFRPRRQLAQDHQFRKLRRVVHDFFREHYPEKAALFDLNMLINTYNGRVLAGEWVRERLRGRGLSLRKERTVSSDVVRPADPHFPSRLNQGGHLAGVTALSIDYRDYPRS
ncbi:MAG: hypothetical protein AB1523_07785 [Bacillota bacterium]